MVIRYINERQMCITVLQMIVPGILRYMFS